MAFIASSSLSSTGFIAQTPLVSSSSSSSFSFTNRKAVAAPKSVIHMGLNASNLQKGKGGKSGKGGKPNAGSGDKSAAAGNKSSGAATATASDKQKNANLASYDTQIDTNRKEYIFQMYKVGKTLPNGKKILNNINLSFFPGAKIGVLGSNGSGKSSLLKIMAGVDTEFDGDALPQRGINIGYLEQEPQLNDGKTVRENIEAAVRPMRDALTRFEEISHKMADSSVSAEEQERLGKEMMQVQDMIEAGNGWELDRILDRAMDALRCPADDADVSVLSGGERRRVALCKLLLSKPDLLLLDEPTNALDVESVAWIEGYLTSFQGTVVCITHDRYFLDNCCQWILELDRGEGIPYEGNYSTYLEKKQKRLQQEEKQASGLQKLITDELEWVRSSAKGRQTKQKARLTRYEELVTQANKNRERAVSNMNQIAIPPGPPLGDIVIQAEDLRKCFGDRILYENVTFDIPKGAIVGIIGPNGVGKTTLFRMIMGSETPDGGLLRVGETVKPCYVDQGRDNLDVSEKTLLDEIADGYDEMQLGSRTVNSRAYLSWFNFRGADQQKKVKNLSGGERNRLSLAKAIKDPGNLLLLDEPTNASDYLLNLALENSILNFEGCVMVISHDRWFLDRIATHILAFEEDGSVHWFEGNCSEYEEFRRKKLGFTDQPHRVKFRKIPV
eukprot:CAMPEP_0184695300 /NCGR_PEP_ID=MMETSP0313-20130426/2983_1 /TAXON_ID=2792 /ORGANISM="Porphyridium aerugineum, Strain SAG 1380-2" /LENGTH=671 /DNA_ID=CAMNT_0027153733 /DNA_START=125 /DNA_END=2140 /DNA_ORIENTATION=-